MKRFFYFFITITLLIGLITISTGCQNSSSSSDSSSSNSSSSESTQSSASSEESGDNSSGSDKASSSTSSEEPINVVMEVNGGQKVEMELYPDVAPKTVENFVKLANEGFYDGLTFHRVIPGFMIQGGDPTGTGTGGSDETITGEFSSNGFENDLKHERGVISMARTNDPNSATSQFFIMVEDTPSLDGEYAAFGKVTSGMDQIDKIAGAETDANDKPVQDQVIEKIYVVD